ncbi:hypothetical protein G6553_16095 [Nocardioides sp. IC4_145]|uniref:hypothetical protein n=1 Tax=Nocardioides sp. IC4_145 TaxID=2714037 RepID=UPI00140D4E67|nr:hypothetical protein [Nocardioides sp. IC4_145]NHC24687.1 hypothetical protein [Nocardioides sp. IC4_145]
MALVRCSCVAQVVLGPDGAGSHGHSDGVGLRVQVLDPECGYVVHRVAAGFPAGPAAPVA